jgi:DNA-binding NarL/FixJ family response regulator
VIKVLVVDDSPLFASGIRMLVEAQPDMRSMGIARDGKEAASMAASEKPDVILMDLRMPVMTGIDAIRAILTDGDPDTSPRVIVLTTIAKDEAVYHALHAGASAFLTKDATPAKLLATIHEAAEERSLPQSIESMSIVHEYVENSVRPGDRALLESLSTREADVFKLVARGLSNGQIGASLQLSEATVKSHVRSILSKLSLTSRVQLVIFAYENKVHEELGWRA